MNVQSLINRATTRVAPTVLCRDVNLDLRGVGESLIRSQVRKPVPTILMNRATTRVAPTVLCRDVNLDLQTRFEGCPTGSETCGYEGETLRRGNVVFYDGDLLIG